MRKHRILAVDDDEAVLAWLRAKLGERYEIVSTTAPREAIELARRTAPALILCDIDMPGFDGGDVSAALYGNDETRHIPVLFLSGLVTSQAQLGGRHVVSKSMPVAELIARIDALIAP